LPLILFTGSAAVSGLLGLFATPPKLQVPQTQPAAI